MWNVLVLSYHYWEPINLDSGVLADDNTVVLNRVLLTKMAAVAKKGL